MKRASSIGRPRKLTDEQVARILAWHKEWQTVKRLKLQSMHELARELGIAPATIYYIIKRRGEYKKAGPTG